MWQGKFDKYIEAIADKSGGYTTTAYMTDKEIFKESYARLKQVVGVPIRVILAVRNHFDVISTKVYEVHGTEEFRKAKKAMKSKSLAVTKR